MARPTIRDLAEVAGVSVATVNRVLSGAEGVREPTREKVRAAAEQISFYGLGAIQSRNAAVQPKFHFGALLLQPHRPFYKLLAQALSAAAASADADIELKIEHLEDLSPENTAARALALAETCQAICLTTAVHPTVMQAVETIQSSGVQVFALISQLAATGQVHYIGLDNWKVGRTAAWAFAKMCPAPGKLGILMGNHRYRNQEMNETGFRSYFREHAPEFVLLEPLPTFESSAVAHEMTESLLSKHPDLAGLYVAGGGISGALAALRGSGRAGKLIVVGYELMDTTRGALLDGTLTLAIAHPLKQLAKAAVSGMVGAVSAGSDPVNFTSVIPFELYTPENI
ncbi:LacI family DNA-binding transcriptional regulator [Mesorhizobium waimense]|uniref:LacI family DNA-binding transcriptional regulator n=1 Tax=Mesorhizobium waimense TaxID=1300307 RepID=A0A3A5KWN8_9HYPH|nr:LacI family DNA-binding transcriptional regulator [Mesorhizobium waimense]